MNLDWDEIDRVIANGLREDLAGGDITTDLLFDSAQKATAIFRAKQEGVIAGLPVAAQVFKQLDEGLHFDGRVSDGTHVHTGSVIAEVNGRVRALLSGERLALNLLQRMSGIATLARKYVDAVAGLPVKILDTRKTAPGLRHLDKYAVRCGGATNHRLNLNELAMIKDNHLKAAGGIAAAVKRLREKNNTGTASRVPIKIEVETANLEQVREAIAARAEIIMLDNMDLATMREAVKLIDHRAQIEASGAISIEHVRAVAETGVDFISIGRLTHSAPALDISMKLA